jgi:hypothetical protein
VKRLFWVGVGFVLGATVVRRRRAPDRARGAIGAWARRHVRGALEEGRAEARRREATMRAVLATTRNETRDADQ